MQVEKFMLDEMEKAFNIPKFFTFKDFLNSGFSLNKEDNMAEFHIELSPWLSTVADWLDDNETEWIHLVQASQTGKTTLEMAFLLYASQKEPTRFLWVQSTEEEAKQFITERLRPYIDGYDPTAIAKRSWKIESFKVFQARVKVGYATNEQTLRSLPAKYVIGDECAVWKYSASLIKKRTRTYTGSRKGIFVTTPPKDGSHHSWQEACEGNFYRWYVPCPDCKQLQPLVIAGLKWEGKTGDIWNYDRVKETTRYKCNFCSSLWDESQKVGIINAGKPVCVDPKNAYKEIEAQNNSTKALQVSALYSAFTSWGETACNFIQAKRSGVDAFKIFITDELAEIPIDTENVHSIKETVASKFIDNNRVSAVIPGYDVYTAGIDVQRNGELYCVICGWKAGVIPTGAVLAVSCVSWQGGSFEVKWSKLLQYFAPFQSAMAKIAIDSTDGLVAQDILDFCAYMNRPYIALKDSTTLHLKTSLKSIVPEISGKKTSKSYNMLLANSDKVKDDISSAFKRTPGEIGSWSFPKDIDPEFMKALTMEHRVTDRAGKSSWSPKYSHAPNHYFSALVYACAAMEEFRVYLQTDLKKQAINLAAKPKTYSSAISVWR
jgi:phage terminase large subunit GpA-like protein